LFDAHPPFQIDGNFAATSGMTEMLLQSQEGFIRLLPGLPGAWPNGEVDGLCARGGFTIGISWRKGHLTQASILSRLGNPCRIYSAQPIAVRSGNSDIQLGEDAGNIYTFSTSPNGKFQIQPTVNPAVSDPINQHQ
jgi:alpha-L-fucosidase 2